MNVTEEEFKEFVVLAKKNKLETASLTLSQDNYILASGYAMGSVVNGIFVSGRGGTVDEAIEKLLIDINTLNGRRAIKIKQLETELTKLKGGTDDM